MQVLESKYYRYTHKHLFLKNLGENLSYLGQKILSGTVFRASHTTPINETFIKAKASLLNVVKKFKFGAKIALTSISLSFITHLLLNKQTQVQLHSLRYHHFIYPPLTLRLNIVPNVQ
jgi:hypothetical protein